MSVSFRNRKLVLAWLGHSMMVLLEHSMMEQVRNMVLGSTSYGYA